MIIFPEQLHMVRRAAHTTQKELARRLQIHPSLVSFWESGKVGAPNQEMIARIAAALELSNDAASLLAESAVKARTVVIPFPKGTTPFMRNVVNVLFTKMPHVTHDQAQQIMKILVN